MVTQEYKLGYTPIEGEFKYGIISNLITPQENVELLDIIEEYCEPLQESISSGEFFIFSEDYTASNKWLHPEGELNDRWNVIRVNIEERLSSLVITEHYPILKRRDSSNMKWMIGLTVSSNKELSPHNDDPVEARELMKDESIPVTSGIYKGVLYLGYPDKDYTGYGTRFYKRESDDVYTQLTEIPFIPGNACIFQADSHSYHGTEYPTFKHSRYTVTLEYF